MGQQFSNATSGLVSAALKAWTVVANVWRSVVVIDARPYRPEAHYMRGPAQSGARRTPARATRRYGKSTLRASAA
jgi:hypothetical protein